MKAFTFGRRRPGGYRHPDALRQFSDLAAMGAGCVVATLALTLDKLTSPVTGVCSGLAGVSRIAALPDRRRHHTAALYLGDSHGSGRRPTSRRRPVGDAYVTGCLGAALLRWRFLKVLSCSAPKQHCGSAYRPIPRLREGRLLRTSPRQPSTSPTDCSRMRSHCRRSGGDGVISTGCRCRPAAPIRSPRAGHCGR